MSPRQNQQPKAIPNNTQQGSLQLDAIFRAFPDLLFYMDNTGRILDYRAGKESFLYMQPGEFLGKHMQDILPKEIGRKFDQGIEQILRTNAVVSLEYRLQVPDGERWFEARMVLVDKNHVIAIVRDMTEHVAITARAQRQLHQLSALHAIDSAITSSFDLHVTLTVILSQVSSQLGVDAADILLLDPQTGMLNFAAGQGFQAGQFQAAPVRVGEGYAGIAVRERRAVSILNLTKEKIDSLRVAGFLQEGFTSTFAVPLIAKGQVKGVLEIFSRLPLKPNDDWFEFLGTLAGRAAIAIDSASLFHDLQQINTELTLAYDAVIEGWAQALELSGRESKEHIRRAAVWTTNLAQIMKVDKKEILNIRRGAILHDIGMMGVPESILQRPGPLSEEERKAIQEHPLRGYQLLRSVPSLAPAANIPRYHHERWDGSGYPEGLYGEQIPLEARIFSVVDVFDTLTSARPYRPALPQQEAMDYLHDQSGKGFDPTVVKAFFQMMRHTG